MFRVEEEKHMREMEEEAEGGTSQQIFPAGSTSHI